MEREKRLAISADHIGNVYGMLDENIKRIENRLNVRVSNIGGETLITGENSDKAGWVMNKLVTVSERGENIDEQKLNYLLDLSGSDNPDSIDTLNGDVVCMSLSSKPVRPKTVGQKQYLDAIRKNTIVFGVGPAGTGKTYLAMAMAITALKTNQVKKIILTRPAIEAGEKLGFLPGDLQQKIDPYLRPLYDALYDIMGMETFQKNMEKGIIEVAPLAYMRGRTLNEAFIVLDEAQNTTPEQMKMFLTRMGFGSKMIITGDITQIDLPADKKSGLKEALKIVNGIEDIEIVMLTSRDVVRHPLIQKIITSYEKYESRNKPVNNRQQKFKSYNFKRKI